MDIANLVETVKESMKSGNYDMVPTDKNKNSRRKYGLSLLDIEDSLSDLSVKDLHKGPMPDRDCPGEDLFVFKKEIVPNVIFYIKLKYKDDQIKIISFHEDEK